MSSSVEIGNSKKWGANYVLRTVYQIHNSSSISSIFKGQFLQAVHSLSSSGYDTATEIITGSQCRASSAELLQAPYSSTSPVGQHPKSSATTTTFALLISLNPPSPKDARVGEATLGMRQSHHTCSCSQTDHPVSSVEAPWCRRDERRATSVSLSLATSQPTPANSKTPAINFTATQAAAISTASSGQAPQASSSELPRRVLPGQELRRTDVSSSLKTADPSSSITPCSRSIKTQNLVWNEHLSFTVSNPDNLPTAPLTSASTTTVPLLPLAPATSSVESASSPLASRPPVSPQNTSSSSLSRRP